MPVAPSATSPAEHGFVITPDAEDPLPATTRSIFVGGAGNLVVRLAGDEDDVTLTGVLAGTVLQVAATHVRATSTADDLVGFY